MGCWDEEDTKQDPRAQLSPADLGERVGDRLAALEQPVQAVRLLLEELHSFHLDPQNHPHLALQAGELG